MIAKYAMMKMQIITKIQKLLALNLVAIKPPIAKRNPRKVMTQTTKCP
jgi:hypothetical protein